MGCLLSRYSLYLADHVKDFLLEEKERFQHSEDPATTAEQSLENDDTEDEKAKKPAEKKKRISLSPLALAALLLTALVGSTVGASIGIVALDSAAQRFANSGEIVINSPENISWAAAAAKVASPSTVAIIASSRADVTTGSGIMLDEEGHIVTSAHVINHLGARLQDVEVQVKTWDGKIYPTTIVGIDTQTDVGVLRIDGEFLPGEIKPAAWGDSSQVNTGDPVIALGSPFDLLNTVTSGIVSNPDRVIQLTSQASEQKISDEIEFVGEEIPVADSVTVRVIQADAPINPGNSGGPLVNERGEVIGLVAAIAGAEYSTGLSFSIKSNNVRRIAENIIETGEPQNALLGVIVRPSVPSWVESGQPSFQEGAVVESVAIDSAAYEAGLKEGDKILTINDSRIDTPVGLAAFIMEQRPGDTVLIALERDGESMTVEAELDSL